MDETRLDLPAPGFQWSKQTGYDFVEERVAKLCHLVIRSLRFLLGIYKPLHRMMVGFFPGVVPVGVLRDGSLVSGHFEAVFAIRGSAFFVELSELFNKGLDFGQSFGHVDKSAYEEVNGRVGSIRATSDRLGHEIRHHLIHRSHGGVFACCHVSPIITLGYLIQL